MAVDTSMYANIKTPNMLEQMGKVASTANAFQENRLLQTAMQQKALELQNAQYGQQAGQLVADHTLANGERDFIALVNDPAFKSNPVLGMKLPSLMNESLAQVESVVEDPENPGSNVSVFSTIQQRNAKAAADLHPGAIHPEALTHYERVNTTAGRVNTVLNKPQISNKDVVDLHVDAMNDGTIDSKQAFEGVTNLTTADGSPPDKMKILQTAAPLGATRNRLNDHFAQALRNPLNGRNTSPVIRPSDQAAAVENQAQGAKLGSTIRDSAQKAVALGDNAKLALKTLDSGIETGAYAPAITAAKAALASAVGEENVPKVTNDLAGMQVLAKELARVTGSQGGSDSTDLARLSTQAQNADITKSRPAIRKILQYVQAQAEQSKAVYSGLTKAHGANPRGQDVNDYNAQVTQNIDPAVFRFKLMDADEKKDFLKENYPGGKAHNFMEKYKKMQDLGLLDSVGR